LPPFERLLLGGTGGKIIPTLNKVGVGNKICYNLPYRWGYSSIGRALPSHGRGRGFESPYLHHSPFDIFHLFPLPNQMFESPYLHHSTPGFVPLPPLPPAPPKVRIPLSPPFYSSKDLSSSSGGSSDGLGSSTGALRAKRGIPIAAMMTVATMTTIIMSG
jgi:hypothetical protein